MLRNGFLKIGYQLWQKEEEQRKKLQYCVNPNSPNQFLFLQAVQGHSGESVFLILLCKTICCYRKDSPSISSTSGTQTNLISLQEMDQFHEERKPQERKTSGILIAVNPMEDVHGMRESPCARILGIAFKRQYIGAI